MRWQRHHIQIKESVLTVLCESHFKKTAFNAVCAARSIIEIYLEQNPDFAGSFLPLSVADDAPELIRKMSMAALAMNVGPMAAVAGTIAEYALTALLNAGVAEAVVDNGGDIALKVNEPVHIGIYGGKSAVKNLAFHVGPTQEILSICTSSGTVGHSFSYGKADAAVVLSADASLADAAATALGNRIIIPADLSTAFDFLKEQDGILGALAICQDQVGLFGELPQLVNRQINDKFITQGKVNGKD